MTKKLSTLLLALVAIATTARAQIIVFHDNVKYVLYNDGTAYVDYSPGAIGTLNLRETVSYNSLTCTVTRIADGAFSHNYQITGNLVIPNTVTHIGKDAFSGCSGLNGTLTLPESLQTIGNNAFYQCTGLTGQLNLPATLTSIGSSAFSDCSGFSGTLTLPPLLTEIAEQTFRGIQFTGDLVVPDGVTAIGDDAFYRNKFSSITIGNGVTTIGHRAFSLTAADQLTLGSSVASIGDEAFRYYDEGSHDHINIKCLNAVPATLGVDVFKNHTQWMVEVPCGARDAYMDSFGWPQGGAVGIPPGFNISETRIKVAKPMLGNFAGYVYYLLNPCDGTATVTHSGYTEDDENNNSYWQQEVVIPSTVEHESEIYRVTKIGARAFKGASEVRIVEIGNYVESIGTDAFRGVNHLTYFTCHNPVPPALGANVFYFDSSIPNESHLYRLTVPCGSVEAYQNAWQWNSFKNFQSLNYRAKVEINGVYYVLNCDGTATVTHAGYSEDDSNSGSYSGYVVIPGTVTYKGETHVVNRIGNNAFKGCVSLTDAIIGENVETIGDNAFEGCTALTRGGSGGDLANIGNNAFKGCTALTSVTIGENVENIGNNAFDGCTALSVISSQRPEPPALGSNVFSGVPTTAVLNVPCTATEAYAAAAQWQDFNIQGVVAAYINAQIDGVYYVLNPCRGTATVTHAGYDEIANAHYMNSYPDAVAITIPDAVTHEGATYDVTRIGNYAFLFSNSLTSIVIGENVGYVGEDAFGGCSGLQSITSKNPTPPTLGWSGNVFQQVPTSAVLYVPCSAVETYAATGGWNRFETIDCEAVVLLDDDSEADTKNHELIQANLGEQVGEVNVRIKGRTLYKSGHWNTLMLPFSLASLAGTPLEDADVRELVPDECSYANGTLTLKFVAASAIEANKPYIVRWAASDEHIVNPLFANVSLENGIRVIDLLDGGILFFGTYDSFAVPELELKHYLYMGGDSKLYYPLEPMNINAFRAFFYLRDYVAGEPSATGDTKEIGEFVLSFGDETTGVTAVDSGELTVDSYYSIDGRRLQGEPTKKGIYIKNGKKVIK